MEELNGREANTGIFLMRIVYAFQSLKACLWETERKPTFVERLVNQSLPFTYIELQRTVNCCRHSFYVLP